MDKLITWLEGRGSEVRAALGRALSKHPNYLSRKLAGERAFTAQDAIAIEKFTKGEVRCEDVLPDLDWAYLRQSQEAAA